MSAAQWCVATLADGQTHLADPAEAALVTARCNGKQFRQDPCPPVPPAGGQGRIHRIVPTTFTALFRRPEL